MVTGAMAFDQTEDITTMLMGGYTPYQYDICLTEPERGDFISIQLKFADENGENLISMPRIGPK